MSSHEIENSLEKIIANLNKDEFIYEFLIAYGISKSVVTRLKKGDQNRSKRENEVLYPKKIIFRVEGSNNLLNAIDDIAQETAILSLWLAEHQMNIIFEERLFEYAEIASILPLKSTGNIKQGNATRLIWESVCPINIDDEVYVIGNPPFEGSRKQSAEQKSDLKYVFMTDYKSLDYICAWFFLGANFIRNKNAKCAFVSTNSVSQGLLANFWNRVLIKNIEIDFAYESFKWKNNAKGNAGVTVVIIGLRNINKNPKYIFKDKFQNEVKNISPYITNSLNAIISGRSKALSNVPPMRFGNMPNDGGNLILSEDERKNILMTNEGASEFIKKYMGGADFIQGKKRFTLWISDSNLKDAIKIRCIKERLEKVTEHRINSTEKSTREKASTPNHFYFSAHEETDSIIIPRTSSENRNYIPIGFLSHDTIIADSAMAIYNAKPWIFAVVTSRMHMVWVRAFGGRLKTDYRYSAKLCYNTFPFPNIDKKQQENLNQYVFDILDARANHPGKTLAWMYDEKTMPSDLKKAHEALDEAVEKCYRLQPFNSDSERLEYLFKLYEKMISEEETKSKK